jgi:predicted dehydrogenase
MSLPTDAMRVGIVGCGDVTSLYLPTCGRYPIIDLAACADLDADRARVLAAKGGFTAMSVEALLADPAIDVVLNLTPPGAHAAVARAAIAAGKHVYSEKPLATTRKDAVAILNDASAAGVRVGGAPDTFLGGVLQTARALIDEGAIGVPLAFSAAFMSLGPESWHPNPDIFYAPGGGPLLDLGPYYVTAIVHLLGPVAQVAGIARASASERQIASGPRAGERFPVCVPTYNVGLMTLATGVIGEVTTTFDVAGTKRPYIEVYGDEGTLNLGFPNDFDGTVLLRRPSADDWTEVPLRFDGSVGRGIGLADMATALRSGRPHRASGTLAYHVLDVMLGILEAAAEGRQLPIASSCERPAALPLGLSLGEMDP